VWFLKTVLWAYFGVKNFHEDEGFRLISITDHVTGIFPRSFICSATVIRWLHRPGRSHRNLRASAARLRSEAKSSGCGMLLPVH
jgi:hypothetical protein